MATTIHTYNPYTLPDFDFVGGSTQDLAFHIYNYSSVAANYGRPISLTDCEGWFSIIDYTHKLDSVIYSKKMTVLDASQGDTDVDGILVNNVFAITIPSSVTLNMYGKFIYQLTILQHKYDDNGKETAEALKIPNQGILFVTNNINKSHVISGITEGEGY